MNWLIGHGQEILIGILSSAVVAIAGYLLHGWFGAKKQTDGAALTAKGAKVEKSPVVNGTGNTQNIIETHHHHYGEQGETQPAANPQPVREPERPKPNLKIVGCKKILVLTGLNGAFHESDKARADGEAVVVVVTNDAKKSAAAGAIIRATLIFEDSGKEVLRGMGCWLAEVSGFVRFRVEDSHSVVLAVDINGRFSVPTKRKVTRQMGEVTFLTDANHVKFQSATVTVRLTNADTGDLYCEEKFDVTSIPLRIAVAK